MKGMIITHAGLEDVAKLEVSEIIGQNSEIYKSVAVFPVKKINDIAKLCYLSRCAKRVLLYLGKFDVGNSKKTGENIQKLLEKTDFFTKGLKPIIKKSHKVECERIGIHDFNSTEMAEIAGKALKKIVGLKTDYKSPFFILYVFIAGNEGYLGIDFCNKDLSKRKYKIYNYGGEIKGTLAYGFLRAAGFQKGQLMIDPFCGTGTIPIEAALYQGGLSPHYYDKEFIFTNYAKFEFSKFDKKIKDAKNIYGLDSKQRYISSAKKNSKIAGVCFNTSRIEAEWLDTKFEKKSVDLLICKPVIPSKNFEKKIAEKIYNDFFYNAQFILKDSGKIAVLTQKPELIIKTSKKYSFNTVKQLSVEAGKATYKIIIFEKGD